MVNKNNVKLTAAQKAELKQAEQKAIAATRLAALNQQRAATQAAAYSQNLAGGVQDIANAAVAGGKFIDTSAAAGYQSPVTGQMTKYLMANVTDPFAAARQAAIKNRMRVGTKGYKKQFGQAVYNDYTSSLKASKASGGSGSSTLGYTPPTVTNNNVNIL
jgi:hypothetical protein